MKKRDNTQNLIRKLEPLLEDLNYDELAVLNKLVVDRIRLEKKYATHRFTE